MSLLPFIKQLLQLARPSRRLLIGLIGLVLIDVIATLPTPFLLAWLIDRLDADLATMAIVLVGGGILVSEGLATGTRVLRVRLNRRFSMDSANRLRDTFIDHLLHLPYPYFLQHQSGGQANRYLNDIDDIDHSISGLVEQGLRNAVMLIVLFATLLWWNGIIGLVALVLLPLTIWAQRSLRRRVTTSSRDKVALREELVGVVAEAVGAAALVKSYNLEQATDSRVAALSQRYRDTEVVMETAQAALRSTASVLLIFSQYAFFVVGALLVIYRGLSLGDFIGQLLLLTRLTAPMNSLLEYGNNLVKSRAALHRVEETLASAREDVDRPPAAAGEGLPATGLGIVLEDLHFRFHPDLPLIEGWNLQIRPGETVALVGGSGSGKTTLLHLLLGYLQPTQGRILIGESDQRQCSLADLRRRIGVVFQEQLLFNASVRDNLLLAATGPVSDEELWQALRHARVAEVVAQMPEGLETRIGVGGISISGGQRQRLTIAQAIIKNPPILLLDEATSALDSFSEQEVHEALLGLMRGRTTLTIAHRLSTIVDADRIVVLEYGRIAQVGSHRELLALDGRYRQLFEAQVSGFLRWDDDELPTPAAESEA